MADDALIGVTQAARELGLSHSTLSRQVKAGLIRSHDGKVKLSEVLEDRANNIDASIWQARKKPGAADDGHSVHAPTEAVHAPAGSVHAPSNTDDADDVVFVDGEAMPLGKAKALKETYLARLRKLEFEVKSGTLVDAETVKKAVFDLSRQDRDSWANWPARVSPLMAAELGVDQVKLAVVLEKYVRQQLAERAQPALRLAS